MKKKKFIIFTLCFYLCQAVLLPLAHSLLEEREGACHDCCATAPQINSACDTQNGPCDKPSHHHHKHHSHDAAHCLVCKSFSQDAESSFAVHFDTQILLVSTSSFNEKCRLSAFLNGSFANRSPPLAANFTI